MDIGPIVFWEYIINKDIIDAFINLENITECNWPSNSRITRDKLIEAFSQTEIEPYKYLGYKSTDGLYRVFNRAVKNLKQYKKPGEQYKNFLLRLNHKFLCSSCKEILSIDRKVKSKKSRNYCKSCDANKISINRNYIYSYLINNPCSYCGEKDPVVLEFHHIKDKKYNISKMKNFPLYKLKEELKKCIVLCSNCHKKETAKAQKWYKGL